MSELFQLVTKLPPAPHLFDAPISEPAKPELNREQQTERVCLKCRTVKITAHPQGRDAYRLWRFGDDLQQLAIEGRVDCPGVMIKQEAAE